MKQIVFATNNKNKLREMREIMNGLYEVLSLDDIGCHEEIIEDADTIEGNEKRSIKTDQDGCIHQRSGGGLIFR